MIMITAYFPTWSRQIGLQGAPQLTFSNSLFPRLGSLLLQPEIRGNYGRESGNRVAAEIVENYFQLWRQAEEAKLEVLKNQGVRSSTRTRSARRRE